MEAALHSEMSGVAAVVVNTSIPVESISALVEKVAVPVCVTAALPTTWCTARLRRGPPS